MDWRERSQIVKESNANICLSNHINSGGGEGAEIIKSIYNSNHLDKNMKQLLITAGSEFRRIFTRTLNNNPKTDYYFMHRETGRVETYIIEYGFADNEQDVQRLKKYWKKFAESIVCAVCLHYNIKYQATNVSTYVNTNDSNKESKNIRVQNKKKKTSDTHEYDYAGFKKKDAVHWLFEKGYLKKERYREFDHECLPVSELAIILQRMYEDLRRK